MIISKETSFILVIVNLLPPTNFVQLLGKTISITESSKIVSDKSSSLEFLCKRFSSTRFVCCPKCSSKKYYLVSRGSLRCSKCKTNCKPFSDTQLDKTSIDYSKWLILIKLFDLGISARRAAREVGVSYPTASHSFDVIRFSILEEQSKTDDVLKGQIEADEAHFGGKRKGNRGRGARDKAIVFGVLERNGKVHVEIVKNVKAKTLLTSTIKKVKKGSIVYTDKWRGYNSLIFNGYKHLSVDHNKMFGKGDVYIKRHWGVLEFCQKRTCQSITESVQENFCCTSRKWNGGATIKMKILSHYCLIICGGK